MTMDAFVARQPVFDSRLKVIGYELLFRCGDLDHCRSSDVAQATAQVVNNTLNIHGIEMLVGDKKIFINMTRADLLCGRYELLPPDQTVLELLETIEPDDEILEACRQARSEGYQLALDDYDLNEAYLPILEEFDIIKFDFEVTTPEARRAFIEAHRDKSCSFLAEKIEHHDGYFEALNLGFDFYQGFFFSKPETMHHREIPSCKLNHLRFLDQINRPALDHAEIESIIRQDVALSFKLLKYLNSAAFGLRSKIESIGHGMRLLGEQKLKRWASLIAVTGLADEKPTELMTLTLVRARLCELIGAHSTLQSETADFFTLGLFSAIDAMLDQPMEQILAGINLQDLMSRTLQGEATSIAPILNFVLAIERADFDSIFTGAQDLGISDEVLQDTYKEAIEWADQISSLADGQGSLRVAS